MKNKIVNVINIDSKIPNLALEKVKKFYKDKGYDIYSLDLLAGKELTYVSCIFDWNINKLKKFEGKKDCFIGGTGYDLTIKLPKEIDQVKPKINIGFTSIGCIRKCKFCVVPIKEGNIQVVGDIYDIWDGKSKTIELLDNNILAAPIEHIKKIFGQIKKENLTLRENGLDIRLVTDEKAQIIKSVSHKEYHFAWDNIKDENKVRKGIDILKRNGINRGIFYVIVGFDSTFEEDLYRFNVLKGLNQRAFCMKHKNVRDDYMYRKLSSWVNSQSIFMKSTFEEYLKGNIKKEDRKGKFFD